MLVLRELRLETGLNSHSQFALLRLPALGYLGHVRRTAV